MLDLIIRANFGVEKLRGSGNTRGQILEFPIEMAGHPYNSAALPRSLWKTKITKSPAVAREGRPYIHGCQKTSKWLSCHAKMRMQLPISDQ